MVAAGSAALAGCAPAGEGTDASAEGGESEALSATGEKVCEGGWSWSVKPEPISQDQISETIDCDICVVGAGASGIPAAMYAALSGAKTVVLQKESTIAFNGNSVGVWGSVHEAELGLKVDMDDVIGRFAREASDGKVNMRLVSNVFSKTGETLDWITSSIITEPAPYCSISGGNHVRYQWFAHGYDGGTNPGLATGQYEGIQMFMENMIAKAEEEGAQVFYETPAVQLVTSESGAVDGVIAQRKDGSYLEVKATKGVILCSGDCSRDEEMKTAYAPMTVGVPLRTGFMGNTGDGTKMALWAGGALEDCPANIQIHICEASGPNTIFLSIPWLHVNNQGKRFANEEMNYQYFSTAVAMQPDYKCYQIIDSHLLDNIDAYTMGSKATAEELQAALDEGRILKADTLEELAALNDIPADALIETVNHYNELVDAGVDTDYGVSRETIVLNGIKDAPFYSIRRLVHTLTACAGIACNEYGQVVDKNAEPIANLYAAGNQQGSFFGYYYPYNGFGGGSLGRCITGGVLAVKHALGTYDEPVAL